MPTAVEIKKIANHKNESALYSEQMKNINVNHYLTKLPRKLEMTEMIQLCP